MEVGPRVGEAPRLGGLNNFSIQSLFFEVPFWGTSPRRVIRSAGPGNTLRWGEFFPSKC